MFQRHRNFTASLLISCAGLFASVSSPYAAAAEAAIGNDKEPVLSAKVACCINLDESHLGKVFRTIYEGNLEQSRSRAKAVQEWIDEGADVSKHPLAPDNEDLAFVTLKEAFDLEALSRIYTSDEPPSSEKSFLTSQATKVLAWFVSKFQPDDGSPTYLSGDVSEIRALVQQLYSKDDVPLLDLPQYPFSSEGDIDTVAETATSGPFARYLTMLDAAEAASVEGEEDAPDVLKEGDQLYTMGLPVYAAYNVKPGLMSLGGQAYLRKVEGQLQTVAIKYEDRWYTQEAANWKQMQDVIMATLSTDLTVVQHYLDTHVLLAGTFCTATHRLPKDHPLRALLHPYTLDTMSINNYNSRILLRENAMFHSMFSFPHAELLNVMRDRAEKFDLRMVDPNLRAEKAGASLAATEVRIWDRLHEHVQAYVDALYADDDAVTKDPAMVKWYNDLRLHMPNQQVEDYTHKLTKESLVKLITLFMFTTTVEHNLVGTMTYNYLPWMNKIPSAVRADGRPATQELVILASFLLLVTQPTSEFSVVENSFASLISDPALRKIAEELRDSLTEIQRDLDQSTVPVSEVQPKHLRVSVNS